MSNLFSHYQWFLAFLVASCVSVLYFLNARNPRLVDRIAVSAHGAVIALLFAAAVLAPGSGATRPWLVYLFWAFFAVPCFLIVYSFVRYQGRLSVHLLQLPNLLAAAWTFFVGTMAVKGSWL